MTAFKIARILLGRIPTRFIVVATLACATAGIFMLGEWYESERQDIAQILWVPDYDAEDDPGEDAELDVGDELGADDDFGIDEADFEAVYIAPEAVEAKAGGRVFLDKDYNIDYFRGNSFMPHRFCETQNW